MTAGSPIIKEHGIEPEKDKSVSLHGRSSDEVPRTQDESSSQGEPAEKQENQQPTANAGDGKDYSIFTPTQKKLIVFVASMAAFISPLSANIYLPALDTLTKDFGVSYSLMDLTVTTYLIFQGIAPTFIGTFGDTHGRRPAYLLCFFIYIIANTALALQRSYPALLILRMVQSAGSSGTVALATGCLADIVVPSQRGLYISLTSLPGILGPSISPILGGVLSQYGGWPWIFYFLVILASCMALPLLLFFPETCRRIVGDGSIPPPRLNQNLLTYWKERKERVSGDGDMEKYAERDALGATRKLRFPNPLAALKIIFTRHGAIILLSNAVLFCCYYAVSIAIPQQFSTRYGYDNLHVSLIYLSIGGGSILSAVVRGAAIDRNYARHAQRLGMPVSKTKYQDLSNFPIERARMEVSMPLLLLGAGTVIGFGWAIEYVSHVAIICVLLFLLGFCVFAGFNTMSILMIDVHPGSPSTATAANNLVRCLLGAAATAVMQPLVDAIGIGWTCTMFALIWIAFTPLLVLLMRKGPEWRREISAREEAKVRLEQARDIERGAPK